jgi:hypothetical protein
MTTVNIIVLADNAIGVNGKKLNEVSLPDVIDRVIAGSSTASYEFLRNKNVIELTGELNDINRALVFITPKFINIDRIDNDEQIANIPKAYMTIIRYVTPEVNMELFGSRNDLYLPTRNLLKKKTTTQQGETAPREQLVSSEDVLDILIKHRDSMLHNKGLTGYELVRKSIAENIDVIIRDFCSKNDMYSLAKFRAFNRYCALRIVDFDKMNELTNLYCSEKQYIKLEKMEKINV